MKPLRRVLHTLAHHPWSAASHVVGLTGLPQRSVYRCLKSLGDAGLLQTASVPLVRPRLHAPSEAGIVELAGGRRKAESYARAFGLESRHLAGALLRAQPLTWAREFLVELNTSATGGQLQWACSPYHITVGRRLLKLDAYGSALWLGRYYRFSVLADPGGLAVQGYVRRFKRLLRWAADLCTGTQGHQLAVVMLTTYERRARQLAVLWQQEVQKTADGFNAEFFVGLGGQAMRHSPGRWWRAGSSSRGALWRGCRGSATAIPRPRPSLISSPSSGPARIESLDEWTKHTRRGQVVRDYVALSGKAWRVLNQVARWPLLRSGDLALLANYGRTGAGLYVRLLGELTERGLVRVVRREDAERQLLELRQAQVKGRLAKTEDQVSQVSLLRRLLDIEDQLSDAHTRCTSPRRYVVSHRGLKLLATTRGMHPLTYGRARLWPVGYTEINGVRAVDLRIKRLLLCWEHTLLANAFFLGLRRLAEREWAMGRNHRLLIWDSWECPRWFYDGGGRRQLLLPDSGGVYQIGRDVYEFWLEIDRGHSTAGDHGRTLRRKFERFYLYRRRPDALYGSAMPRVLVVTRQMGRARQVRDVVLSLANERGEPPLPLYLTALDDIWLPAEMDVDGTLRPSRDRAVRSGRRSHKMWPGLKAWRRVDRFGRFTWCFEGLGQAPPDTQRGLDLHRLQREVRAHTRRNRAQQERRQRERARETAEKTCTAS